MKSPGEKLKGVPLNSIWWQQNGYNDGFAKCQ